MLTDHFVPARINTEDRPDLVRQFNVFWSPTLVTLHHLGLVLRASIGYLPPREMLAELTLIRGLDALRSARSAESFDLFARVAADFPSTAAVAEARYWQGVAAYRRSRDKEDLWVIWRQLAADHPHSLWAAKTTLFPEEDSPA